MSLAAVFPGQGSQAIGMLAGLSDRFSLVRETFQQASDVLGIDLWSLAQHGPREELDQTALTQPIMLTAGVAVWRAWDEEGGCAPVMLAGHSLGEYTALVCAGSIDYEEAVRLVAERGRLMQQAVSSGDGSMAAILGLSDERVVELCNEAAQGEVVEAANYNAPGQVVVAGHVAAVERLMNLARGAGAKRVVPLPVSVPSHCSLMAPAAKALREVLAKVEIRPPRIPVIHNYDVLQHDDPEAIREALVRQLDHPVRWVEVVETLAGEGVTRVFEFGPGKVLSGLTKRIDRSLKVLCIEDSKSLDAGLNVCEEFGV